MASLTGNKIKDTYPGLIKTDDNAIVGATEKQITDGEGNAIPMTMGTSGVSFTGDADFTGATVTGLPTGSAGLESGTGTDSMQSAASLTTLAANASGTCTIAIGNGACARKCDSVAIGNGALAGCDSGDGFGGIAIGLQASAQRADQISIGRQAGGGNNYYGIHIGRQAASGAFVSNGIALGREAIYSAANAVAIGYQVSAAKADTVTVKELETCVAGGGIYLTTPDGLAQPKLTVDNTCALLVDGSPVGGGGDAGLVNGTGTCSLKNADSLVITPVAANGDCSVALGNAVTANGNGTVAIGNNVTTGGIFQKDTAVGDGSYANYASAAFGQGARACGQVSAALGSESIASADRSVAIGFQVTANKADTVTVCELETCVAGGGIYLTTPDGLAQPKLTVDNTCALLVDGSPIGGGSAGLVAGTATDSMKNADSLVTNPATACGNGSIAFGDNSTAGALGIALGVNSCTSAARGVAIGYQAIAYERSNAIGFFSSANGFEASAYGTDAQSNGSYGAAIGSKAKATCNFSAALGYLACATAEGAVALGCQVTAAKTGTTTVNELETCAAGGGITMKSPDTTEYKVTVDNDGILQINGTSYTPKTSFALERYSGQQSDFGCDTIQASILIPAGTIKAGDIWELRAMESATGSTGFIYTAFWISSTGTIGTSGNEGVNLGQTQTPDASWTSGYNKAMYVHTADGTGAGTTTWRGTEVSDSYDAVRVSGASPDTWAIDWTVDQYLVSRICIDNAEATYVMHGATLHKIG